MAFRDFWRRDPHRDERQHTHFSLDPLSRESWREDSQARFGDRPHHDYSAHDEGRRFDDRWQNSYSGPGYGAFRDSDRDRRGENYGGARGNPFYGDRPLAHAGESYDSGYFGANGLPKTPWQPDAADYEQRELVYGNRPSYESDEWQTSREQTRTSRGQFRGVGPRGYRRSDERIKEDVCQCLTDDHHIDASNIEVAVKDREVVLTGTVQSRAEKRHAEDLIERLPGVRDVVNSLRVVATETSSQSAGVTPERYSGNWR